MKDNIKGKLLIDLHDSIEFRSILNRYHQLFAYKRKGGLEGNVTQSEFSDAEWNAEHKHTKKRLWYISESQYDWVIFNAEK